MGGNNRMNKKELLILSQFRKNARENLTTASRKIHVPISTLHDRLKRYEGSIITKHTALLNFGEIGFHLKVQIILKVNPTQKKAVRDFLTKQPKVNTVYALSNDYDFLFELILKDLFELTEFTEKLETFHIIDKHEFYIVEDVKREAFLTDLEWLDAEKSLNSSKYTKSI